MPIVPQSNGSEPPKVSASFVDLQTIRIRLLNALGCPARIISLETTIASLMVGRESAGYGLEALAECLGYDNRRSVSRLLDESATWQRAANISLCTVLRGQRNVRRVHQFITNKLNAAAFFILSQLESNPDYSTPLLAQIDAHAEAAILTFLRLPLTTAHKCAITAPSQKPKRQRKRRTGAAGGGSVYSWDIFCTVPKSLRKYGLRFFPLDGKTPRIWKYRQCATKNPTTLCEWYERWPASSWGILTGTQLEGGGFLVVVDLDRHGEGEQFGNGFKTLALREKELGSLPETFTAVTKNQGEHRYFRSKLPLPTWSKELGPGLDSKGIGSGFVVAPGSPGYDVINDLPIADLPEAWENALNVRPKTERRIPVGERHNYLRRVSYSMACKGKSVEQIGAVLRERLRFNYEAGGRVISERELVDLAESARQKIYAADRMLDVIVA
jgi:hypothetical protein